MSLDHARYSRSALSSLASLRKAVVSVSENINDRVEVERRPSIGTETRTEVGPPPTLLSSTELPGAHFLTWRVRKANRDPPCVDYRCSPMHSPRKDQWLQQTIDSKVSSLPIPPARVPRVHFFPCPSANNLSTAFKRYARFTPGLNASLPGTRTSCVRWSWPLTIETPASIFAKCQVPTRTRYTVHPDWRREK